MTEIKEHIKKIDGVEDIHHIHVWSMDGHTNFATMHIVTDENAETIKEKVKEELKEHGIAHATLELEKTYEHCHEEHCYVEPDHSHGHCHHHHH